MGIKEGIWVGENQVGIVFKKGKKEILVPGREVLSVTGGVKSIKESRVDLGEIKPWRIFTEYSYQPTYLQGWLWTRGWWRRIT